MASRATQLTASQIKVSHTNRVDISIHLTLKLDQVDDLIRHNNLLSQVQVGQVLSKIQLNNKKYNHSSHALKTQRRIVYFFLKFAIIC